MQVFQNDEGRVENYSFGHLEEYFVAIGCDIGDCKTAAVSKREVCAGSTGLPYEELGRLWLFSVYPVEGVPLSRF